MSVCCIENLGITPSNTIKVEPIPINSFITQKQISPISLIETISSDNLYLTHNSTDPNAIIIFENGKITKKYSDSFIDRIINHEELDNIKKRIFENIIKFAKDLDDIIITLNFVICVKNKNFHLIKEIYEKYNQLDSHNAETTLKILKNKFNE